MTACQDLPFQIRPIEKLMVSKENEKIVDKERINLQLTPLISRFKERGVVKTSFPDHIRQPTQSTLGGLVTAVQRGMHTNRLQDELICPIAW